MNVNWSQIPKGSGINISPAWHPITEKMYILAINGSRQLWLKIADGQWQQLMGEAVQASLIWSPELQAIMIYAAGPGGNLWLGRIIDGEPIPDPIPDPNPTPTPDPTPEPIPPDVIILNKHGYGQMNYGTGLDPFHMAAGQKKTFILPIEEVVARPDYAYYPTKDIHKLHFHTTSKPEGNGEIKITMRAPTGEVWVNADIASNVTFNFYSQKYPEPTYQNYQHVWIDPRPWIVEIEAIKTSDFIIWWFPTPKAVW